MHNLIQGYLARLPASLREEEVTDDDGTVKKIKALRLYAAFASGHHGNALARCRGGYHQG